MAERKPISAQVEFFVDAGGILEAEGIDVSETGLAFSASEPLSVALVVTIDGEEMTRMYQPQRLTDDTCLANRSAPAPAAGCSTKPRMDG